MSAPQSKTKDEPAKSGPANEKDQNEKDEGKLVGLAYESECELHKSDASHRENGARTSSIWDGLKREGLVGRCVVVPCREATDDEIVLAHDLSHLNEIKDAAKVLGEKIKWWDEDTYFNKHSERAVRLACGGLLALCDEVAKKRLQHGFAVIRPPGHHADTCKSQGFCIFNNVAVAAAYVLNKYPQQFKRVLIVDWDVHHGNGTQNIFWDRTDVLYFSIHRYDDGHFYPKTGHPESIGSTSARGYNINVALNGDENGDPEYMHVWKHLLLPVATSYKPDLILISAGFDCAVGDPLGELNVSTDAFGHLTHQLMQAFFKPVVLALEGGYRLAGITDASVSCVKALLNDPLTQLTHSRPPNKEFVQNFNKLVHILQPYWPVLSPPPPAANSPSAPTPTPTTASAPTSATASAPTPPPTTASAPTSPPTASAPTPTPTTASAPSPPTAALPTPTTASAPTPPPATSSASTPPAATAPAASAPVSSVDALVDELAKKLAIAPK